MLMVVFGAGASYDSAPSYPAGRSFTAHEADRMPLANQLFDNRPQFAQALSRFPRCQPIVPYLRGGGNGIAIEHVLQVLQEEAAFYPERHSQLAAVRYYLHVMLWECEARWNEIATQGVTNQKTLLDQIERWRKPDEQVCLVTFNYDTMLETALVTVGIEIQTLSDYIVDSRYKLIKLHGSVNWARRVKTPHQLLQQSAWPLINTLIDHANELEIVQAYTLVDNLPIHADEDSVLFPALAIPVEAKLDFECPKEHLEALQVAIPEVDKLMIIGWRAAETSFLELLAQNIRQPVRGLVVAESSDAANETADRLKTAGVNGHYEYIGGGFTDFIVDRLADDFLSS